MGETVDIAGPRPGHSVYHSEGSYLVGDPTSSPAIAAILVALPVSAEALVLVEAAGRDEKQLLIT
jgi:NADPH-dependent ferric siderophore reductase